ncbi:CoA ester lyase [Humibacter sp. RRB41]|uniref:HpcH/HpaI aldolase/citrate lyase family protein n=1 Tax=Humibacter sp. RRB41 TaxID=2919946 RepID=UPI001FAAD5B4|nr:CoA ester lyase [Humibacter sp. RRB41]
MNRRRLGLAPALLFCPADRPDRYRKALERADAVILDLEDGVAPADRPAARAALVAFGRDTEADLDKVIVRVNPVSSPDHAHDVAAVRATPFRTVMLAKAESSADVAEVAGTVDDVRVVALCETAKGVLEAAAIAAHSSTVALMWGAEDLIVSLGGVSSRTSSRAYRDIARHARSTVLLAAGAHGIDAIDAVHIDLEDLEGLAEEAADAVASGFAATACLHPRQVEIVREAYRPHEQQIALARRVIEAADGAPGAFRLDGRMVDEPIIAQARAVMRRAQQSDHRP